MAINTVAKKALKESKEIGCLIHYVMKEYEEQDKRLAEKEAEYRELEEQIAESIMDESIYESPKKGQNVMAINTVAKKAVKESNLILYVTKEYEEQEKKKEAEYRELKESVMDESIYESPKKRPRVI